MPTGKRLLFTYNNQTKSLKEWSEEYGISKWTLYQRIKKYKMNFKDALLTPIIHKYKIDVYQKEDGIIITDEVCSYFGCSEKLTITEKLCGDRCISHQGIKNKYDFPI